MRCTLLVCVAELLLLGFAGLGERVSACLLACLPAYLPSDSIVAPQGNGGADLAGQTFLQPSPGAVVYKTLVLPRNPALPHPQILIPSIPHLSPLQ